MSEAELRAGVDPVDELLAERLKIVDLMAPLFAEYGPGGTAEHRLSATRCAVIAILRAQAAERQEKITEAALESGARVHDDYIGLLTRMTEERAEFFNLQAELYAIDARINRGQALLRMIASEPK